MNKVQYTLPLWAAEQLLGVDECPEITDCESNLLVDFEENVQYIYGIGHWSLTHEDGLNGAEFEVYNDLDTVPGQCVSLNYNYQYNCQC